MRVRGKNSKRSPQDGWVHNRRRQDRRMPVLCLSFVLLPLPVILRTMITLEYCASPHSLDSSLFSLSLSPFFFSLRIYFKFLLKSANILNLIYFDLKRYLFLSNQKILFPWFLISWQIKKIIFFISCQSNDITKFMHT